MTMSMSMVANRIHCNKCPPHRGLNEERQGRIESGCMSPPFYLVGSDLTIVTCKFVKQKS